MEDARRIVFDSLRDRLCGVDFEHFQRALSDFEFLPVKVGGQTVGAILRKGSELHAAVLPCARGKWIGRSQLRVVAETIRKHGEATSSVMNGHEAGHRFARRLGFVECGRDNRITYYRKAQA